MQALAIRKQEYNILNKHCLGSYEQLGRFFPNYYYDLRNENGLNVEFSGQYVCVIGTLFKMQAKEGTCGKYVTMKFQDRITKQVLTVNWFNAPYMIKKYQNGLRKSYLIYGKLVYNEEFHFFSMTNPIVMSDEIEDERRIIAQYKKFTGISKEMLNRLIQEASYFPYKEYIPQKILEKTKLLPIQKAVQLLHYPNSIEDIRNACKRFIADDLLYFAIGMQKKDINHGKEMPLYQKADIYHKVISELPFELTEDQFKTVEKIKENLELQKSINALIQGDVGCGKTITAFLLMFLAAENHYQSVLMAPTEVLATQHYKELSEMGEKYGFKTIFLHSKLKTKEKKEALKKIESGEIHFVVGTHSVTTQDVNYNNLGMIIVDEEHRFGVNVKECLKNKAKCEAPYITMSATPIPRSIAELVFSTNRSIFEIKSVPAGRQKTDTFCYPNFDVPNIVEEELAKGRQIYVVCPQIEKTEDGTEENSILRHSVQETYEMYCNHFKGNPSICIKTLTGGNNKAKNNNDEILRDFSEGKIQILIATTVIEVGVNNPNASVIVIQDADCYGLATLHQLRGRVKRGKYKPYCILMSPKGEENPRLKILCETEDGFKIAEEDYRLRKSGNLLGTEQSGNNKYIELVESYPNMYSSLKEIAKEMIEDGTESAFVEYMDLINSPNEDELT